MADHDAMATRGSGRSMLSCFWSIMVTARSEREGKICMIGSERKMAPIWSCDHTCLSCAGLTHMTARWKLLKNPSQLFYHGLVVSERIYSRHQGSCSGFVLSKVVLESAQDLLQTYAKL